ESIRVYGLWRPGLTQARRDLCHQIRDCIEEIKSDRNLLNNIIILLSQMPDNDILLHIRNNIEQGIVNHMAELSRFQNDHKPYSEMAKQLVARFLQEIY
ncbi:unnamed protein product, partial [marine sediment metagenome]